MSRDTLSMDAIPSELNHNQSLFGNKMVKKEANMVDVSKNAGTKYHDHQIILIFYGTTEKLACWEIGVN